MLAFELHPEEAHAAEFGAEFARREHALLVPLLDLGQDPAPDPLAGDVADRALLIGQ